MADEGKPLVLRRDINLLYASSILTGVVIGSGIFVSPTSIITHCYSVDASLLIWVVSGILMLCIALCYVEMGAMFPRAGGEYFWFKHIIGTLPAFLFAWISLVAYYPPFYALLALTTSNYLLYGWFGTCEPPYSILILLSVWILVTVVTVNSTYVKYVVKFQVIFTAAKLIGLGLIIFIGAVKLVKGDSNVLSSGLSGFSKNPGDYVSAIYSGLFTYGGWGYVFLLLEEVKNPERVVPRATIISLLFITALYTFTNVAYFTVLTPHDMMSSSAVAMTFADRTIGRFAAVIPILVACSTIGAINGSILGGTRVYFAAARDDLIPVLFSTLSTRYNTPWPSLIYTCIITTLYIITGSAVTLIEYIGFVGTLVTCMTIGCLLYMRYKEPDRHRPFKVPLWLAILMLPLNIMLLVIGLYHAPQKYGYGLLIILAGVPMYGFITLYQNKPQSLLNLHRKVTIFVEKLLLVFPSDPEQDDN